MKKLLALSLALSLILLPTQPIWAAPSAPSAPTAPTTPNEPTAPTSPVAPVAPTNPTDPTPTPAPTTQTTPVPTVTNAPTPSSTPVEGSSATNSNTGADSQNTATTEETTNTDVSTTNQAEIDNTLDVDAVTGENASSKNTGDASVKSGDATVLGSLQNTANQTQQSVAGACTVCASETVNPYDTAKNNSTGAGSTNNASTSTNTNTNIQNTNTADLNNDVDVNAVTGVNHADANTGNAEIETGDANVGLTVVNTANTNIDGVKTSEFDVYDDHRGDIVVDFADVAAGGAAAGNNSTGANSTNSAKTENNRSLTIVNDNDATVMSDLAIDAVTGQNTANKNTGDGSIKTGDANVVANVLNLVNNTLNAGAEILVATVNIFGNQAGDLILKDSSTGTGTQCGSGCVANGGTAGNYSTGADSFNDANTTINSDAVYLTNNQADVTNYMDINANTGGNVASSNTGGGSVKSGSVNVSADATTMANTTTNGDWWLVIVNEAGRWVGHIVGAEGQTVASNGTIDFGAVNNGTGAGSNNYASASQSDSTSVTQNNTADVDTKISINADTGNNSASKNTGSGSVESGDVNIAANIVNFVNNNFSGGKVMITFVNIFGDWAGNIYTPDHQKVVLDSGDEMAAETSTGSEVGGIVSDNPYANNVDAGYVDTSDVDEEAEEEAEYVYEYSYIYRDSEEDATGATTRYYTRRAVNPYVGRVLGSVYAPDSSTVERIRANQWLVEDDPTITVTPGPEVQAAIAYDTGLNPTQWLMLVAAGGLLVAGYGVRRWGSVASVRV